MNKRKLKKSIISTTLGILIGLLTGVIIRGMDMNYLYRIIDFIDCRSY